MLATMPRVVIGLFGFAVGYIANALIGGPPAATESPYEGLSPLRTYAVMEIDRLYAVEKKVAPGLLANWRNNAVNSTSATELRADADLLESKGLSDASNAFDALAEDIEAVV